MIECRGVSKFYGSRCGVQGLSFTLGSGIIGLLGQNGAGKTTTLNLLTGYFPPSEGAVLMDGTDLRSDPRGCKRKIGYLPERPPLYDEMTVAEYLRFVAALRETPKPALKAHVAEVMALCGVEDRADQLIGTLSKGFRQRVGIAQALCGDPQVLILDEPTVGLDPLQVTEIRALMREIGKTHAVIFSSHYLAEVQQLCSRVLILHHGRQAADIDLTAASGDARWRLVAEGSTSGLIPGLRSLPGVTKVFHDTKPADGLLHLTLTQSPAAQEPLPPRIFRLCAALDAPIHELTPLRDTLEETFLRVTADP